MDDVRFKKGTRCGSYELVRPLGSGGMGSVWEAFQRYTGAPVALKLLLEWHDRDADGMARLRREAEALAILKSRNIVTVLDFGLHEGMPFMVLELLTGTTLRSYMRSAGKLPLTDALFVARELADGLDEAHEFSIVHRDVKPENVQITAAREIKLFDFGACKQYGQGLKGTDRLRILGTPHYMSPEHLLGHKVDSRTDLYALGVILYEMLAGRHPHDTGNAPLTVQEISQRQLHGTPAPLQDLAGPLPKGLMELVVKLMAKSRDDRYGDAGEVSDLFDFYLRDAIAGGKTGKLGPYDAPGSGLRKKGGRTRVTTANEELQAVGAEQYRGETASTDVTLEIPRGDAPKGGAMVELPSGGGTLPLKATPLPPREVKVVPVETAASEEDWLRAARVPIFSPRTVAASGEPQTDSPGPAPVHDVGKETDGAAASELGSVTKAPVGARDRRGRRRAVRFLGLRRRTVRKIAVGGAVFGALILGIAAGVKLRESPSTAFPFEMTRGVQSAQTSVAPESEPSPSGIAAQAPAAPGTGASVQSSAPPGEPPTPKVAPLSSTQAPRTVSAPEPQPAPDTPPFLKPAPRPSHGKPKSGRIF